MEKKRLAVIGNGMATSRLLDDLLMRGAQRMYAITVYSEEIEGCYNRILLGRVLTGGAPESIMLKPPRWYVDEQVNLVPETRVTQLDTSARLIKTANGPEFRYDIAILATGSAPFVPRIENLTRPDGRWKEGLIAYRTLDDCRKIRARARPGDLAIVVGGGLLGLEAAKALSDLGLHVTIVDIAETLMTIQLDRQGGEILRRQIERCGIFVRTGRSTRAILGVDYVEGVQLDDGTTLPADILVLACGIRPRIDVASASGIPVRKGVIVNDTLATQVPGVYALGECAEHDGKVYGIVAPIWEQATVLADVLSGFNPQARYRGSKLYTRLKVAGIEVASMGLIEPVIDTDEVIQVIEEPKSTYRKLIVRDNKLVGSILVGDTEAAASLVHMFDTGEPLPANRLEALCVSHAGISATMTSREICNCHKVNESDLIEAVQAGASSIDELGESTRAGTGCGSCRGQLSQIIQKHRKAVLSTNGTA